MGVNDIYLITCF